MSTNSEPAKSCRHLVSLRDPSSFFAYPSAVNACGRFEPPGALPASHQSRFCLTVRHASCPLLATTWTGPFPAKLEKAAESDWGGLTPPPRGRWRLPALGALGIMGVVGVLWWTVGAEPVEAPADSQGEPTPPALVLPQLAQEPNASLEEPLPLPSPIAALPTQTAPLPTTPTPGPDLEMLFGADQPYLIHSVQAGETLFALADAFQTSPEAIRAANGLGEHTLAIGQLLVIPVGISDPANVPSFLVMQVGEGGEALADLAARNGADPESIRRYNALGEDPLLPPGRWLIVPVERAR